MINYEENYYRAGYYSTAISNDGKRIAIELQDDYLTLFDSNLKQIGKIHVADTEVGLGDFSFDEPDHNVLYCEHEDMVSNDSVVSRIDFRKSSVKESPSNQ